VQVFLSYRRSDAGGHAGRLAETLASRLGHHRVIHDVTAAGGQDVTAAVDRALARCDVVVSVIGPGWQRAAGPAGMRRLFQPEDYVHVELARALRHGVPVLPVLVGGATLPAPADLPPDLRGLVRRPPVTLHDATWQADVAALLRAAGELRGDAEAAGRTRPRDPGGRRARPVLVGLALALVVVLAAGAAWAWRSQAEDGSAESSSGLAACPDTASPAWHELAPIATKAELPLAEGSLFLRVATARWRMVVAGTFEIVLGTELENLSPDSHPEGSDLYQALVVSGREFPPSCFAAEPPVVASNQKGRATVGFQVGCEPTGRITLTLRGGVTSLVAEGLSAC
jgi:TIR domain